MSDIARFTNDRLKTFSGNQMYKAKKIRTNNLNSLR